MTSPNVCRCFPPPLSLQQLPPHLSVRFKALHMLSYAGLLHTPFRHPKASARGERDDSKERNQKTLPCKSEVIRNDSSARIGWAKVGNAKSKARAASGRSYSIKHGNNNQTTSVSCNFDSLLQALDRACTSLRGPRILDVPGWEHGYNSVAEQHDTESRNFGALPLLWGSLVNFLARSSGRAGLSSHPLRSRIPRATDFVL